MRFISTLFTLALLVLNFPAMADELVVTDAQIRVPMPGRTVTAGYFTLTNHNHDTVSLVAAESPAFKRVELHQHVHKDGVMRMEQITQIDVASHASVQLKPGGLHLMLFEPQHELKVGESVSLTLHFADKTTLTTQIPLVSVPKR